MNKPLSINPEAFEELRHLHAFHTRYVGKFTARLEQLNNVPGFPLPKRQRSIANAELRLAIHSAAVRALDLLFDVPRFASIVITGGGCCSLNCPNETPDGGLFCSACKALSDSADEVEALLHRQLDIERIRANALQERLNATDERVDVLEGLLREAQAAFNYDPEGSCDLPGIAFIEPWSSKVTAALKPAADREA